MKERDTPWPFYATVLAHMPHCCRKSPARGGVLRPKARDRMNTNHRMRFMAVQLDSAPSAAESETKLGSKDQVTLRPLDSDTTI